MQTTLKYRSVCWNDACALPETELPGVLRCKRCQTARYCSVACQAEAFKSHRKYCKDIARRASAAEVVGDYTTEWRVDGITAESRFTIGQYLAYAWCVDVETGAICDKITDDGLTFRAQTALGKDVRVEWFLAPGQPTAALQQLVAFAIESIETEEDYITRAVESKDPLLHAVGCLLTNPTRLRLVVGSKGAACEDGRVAFFFGSGRRIVGLDALTTPEEKPE